MRRGTREAALAASIVAVVTAAAVTATSGASASTAAAQSAPATSCQLGNGVKHVVEILFANTHYNRDNPNVLSDLEQMPALKNFITDHGTLLSNMHTPLIALGRPREEGREEQLLEQSAARRQSRARAGRRLLQGHARLL